MLLTPMLLLALLLTPLDEPAPKPRVVDTPKTAKKKDDTLPISAFKLRSVGPAVTSGRIVGLAVHPTDKSTYHEVLGILKA